VLGIVPRYACLITEAYIVAALPRAERQLISAIRDQAARFPHNRELTLGIGDDAALLRVAPGSELLVTTDFSLEGVHFRRDWHPPESIGHRCLARGLSDIAAMGGKPVAAFLSLALPAKLPQRWVDRFLKGFLALASQFSVPLAGGDTAQSPSGVLADIVVVGSVPKGKAILRSGAKTGDRIYVTGMLGRSVAALTRLRRGEQLRPRDFPEHFSPMPRIAVGRYLREHRLASAMIDLSDGLSTDLSHLCEESRVGALLHADLLPTVDNSPESLAYALHGGEDYELLFTARRNRRVPKKIAGVALTQIGEVLPSRGSQMWLESEGLSVPLKSAGWEHFKK
jgi:thiamine-monophosphate kinase